MRNWIFLFVFVATAAFASDESAPVTCAYESRVKTGSASHAVDHWTFIRTTNSVCHVRSNRSDIWTLLGKQVGFEQMFHDQKVLIEYSPGDIRAVGSEKNWRALSEIIDSNILSKLKQKGTRKIAGFRAERFVGEIDGVSWEICWIPELRLPGKIVTKEGKNVSETVLKRIGRNTQASIETSDYRRVDYADLGDLESDKVIQAILRNGSDAGHKH